MKNKNVSNRELTRIASIMCIGALIGGTPIEEVENKIIDEQLWLESIIDSISIENSKIDFNLYKYLINNALSEDVLSIVNKIIIENQSTEITDTSLKAIIYAATCEFLSIKNTATEETDYKIILNQYMFVAKCFYGENDKKISYIFALLNKLMNEIKQQNARV